MSENTRSFDDFDTVDLDEERQALAIIDQTKLPSKMEMIYLTKQEDIWDAIYLLKVRGAPAIGVAAAIGIYLAAKDIKADSYEDFLAQFRKAKDYLDSSRPTAVNLSWALKRQEKVVLDHAGEPIEDIVKALHDEAVKIREEDIAVCRAIGEYGLTLIKDGDGLLTHCNAGRLAAVKYGTATAPMYVGAEKGYKFKIFADETRPLLQGARLTAFELAQAGMDVTLECDNMSATAMRNGWIQAVFVGCDRVAANGDAANKIGTSMVALAAKRYNVPFYVCAPTSTIDMDTPTGKDIKIEQRKPEEVTEMWYKERMAPENINVFNPAFDVTDSDLITGIVTEYGIARPPYKEAFEEIFRRKNG
ncbi:MAG: S-methyl-5-thioribose-1-phosphate isomerase [Lachnospiraceae bacterium]|nr:S-methyl-5-thioribose-1-phosphate isomerase [Lachnospiraceae bacterium]MDY6221438.1 S-methyl-5-thioribose-1-phosphate isomerase [Candidatus Alectryocaccobium sp.]